MSLRAFKGNADELEAALGRVAAKAEAKKLVNGSLMWDGDKGSFAGCMAETSDAAEWEDRTGLARWVALALDAMTSRLGPESAAVEGSSVMRAIPVGADTSTWASLLVCKLLNEFTSEVPVKGELATSLETIVGMHQRHQRGDDVLPAEWRKERQRAMKATDALVPPPEGNTVLPFDQAKLRTLGAAIEAAAWDPLRSPSCVSEVLRQWLSLETWKGLEQFGWTGADDALIRKTLDEMHAKHIKGNSEEKRSVFDFLEVDHPEIAKRLRDHSAHTREDGARTSKEACAMFRRLLESMS